uniref:Uncharacterized protein MANES_08G120400 n=1 Tax=Rhizophora mucronata TaxID=61149 RepID=A0A2P2K232_RHIMU
MGCCGDEDDAVPILTQPLNPTTEKLASSDVSADTITPATTISPMNSHFAALSCADTLRLIFEKLSLADLARASCVCRAWNAVAADGEIMRAAFMGPWKLKAVVGRPVSGSFWRDNGIWKFAISHKIVRGDTVASLAVKYSVQVLDFDLWACYGFDDQQIRIEVFSFYLFIFCGKDLIARLLIESFVLSGFVI